MTVHKDASSTYIALEREELNKFITTWPWLSFLVTQSNMTLVEQGKLHSQPLFGTGLKKAAEIEPTNRAKVLFI